MTKESQLYLKELTRTHAARRKAAMFVPCEAVEGSPKFVVNSPPAPPHKERPCSVANETLFLAQQPYQQGCCCISQLAVPAPMARTVLRKEYFY